MTGIVSDAIWIFFAVLRVFAWFLKTLWLGVDLTWRSLRILFRLRLFFVQVRWCPRGHRVPMYGLYECPCGASHEGWVFGACQVCGESCGWTPCLVCGLPVRNPVY